MNVPAQFDHESWRVAAGTVASYLLVLVGMTVLFFLVPFLLFTLL